jgi:hypothetical protein
MNEDKIKELLMTLRIYLKYSKEKSFEAGFQQKSLEDKLNKLIDELLPE